MLNKYYLPLLVLFIFYSNQVLAADGTKEKTIEESIPKDVFQDKRHNILSVVIENDSIGSQTDNNYTSGVRFNYTDVGGDFPELSRTIDKIVPTFKINDTTALYYSFGQNLYSPRDTARRTPNLNDRPWAAFLYGSMGMVTLTDNHLDEVEATLGVIGPAALGKQTQRFVHKYVTDSPEPKGWANQLENEPAAILAWQRSWPMFVNGHVGKNFWSIKPYTGVTLGNVYTYGDVGIGMRLSPADSKWQDMPVRVRPAMPGTGIYEVPENKWSWAVFSGVEARAVARDIFLDGNSFSSSYSIDKKPLVMDATAGVAFTYQQYRLTYSLVYRTKEFYKQTDPQVFGAVSGSVRF